jgi:hypothetical protein
MEICQHNQHQGMLHLLAARVMAQAHPAATLPLEPPVRLAHSKTLKEDYPLVGKGEKTILGGLIMWITTLGLQAGVGQLLGELQKLTGMSVMPILK